MDCSMAGFPVHHQFPELAQSRVHWVGDAIQPSHPLSSPSPLAFNLSQHQGFFQWVSSSHQVARVLGKGYKWHLIHSSNQPTPLKKKMKSFSRVQLFVTLWMVAYQAPPSMGFSRQEYWSGLPFPSPGNLHSPGIKPRFPALQADALLSEPPRKPQHHPTGLSSAHSPQSASLESTPMSLPFSLGCEHPEQGIEPVHHLYIPWQRIWNIIDKMIKLRTILWNISRLPGFPGGTGKEPACQCSRYKRCGFDPWVRKIPWRRTWQPTPVFLPGESHGQRSLGGYSSQGGKEWDMNEATQHTPSHTHITHGSPPNLDRQDIPPLLLQERKNKHSY